MPAYIPIPGVVETALNLNWRAHPTVMAFNWLTVGEITETTLTDLATYVRDWWDQELSELLSSDIALLTVTATDLETVSGITETLVLTTPIPGDVAEDSVGNNTQGVHSWRTPKRGRSYRGRTFIPGIPVTALQSPNLLDTGEALSLAAAMNMFLTDPPRGIVGGSQPLQRGRATQ